MPVNSPQLLRISLPASFADVKRAVVSSKDLTSSAENPFSPNLLIKFFPMTELRKFLSKFVISFKEASSSVGKFLSAISVINFALSILSGSLSKVFFKDSRRSKSFVSNPPSKSLFTIINC